jgi:hypothetical protein
MFLSKIILSTKPISPDQARLKALKDKADKARNAVKAELADLL